MTGVDLQLAEPSTGGRQCGEVDVISGAVCTRNRHVVDAVTHWFEDENFRIQWATAPTLTLP